MKNGGKKRGKERMLASAAESSAQRADHAVRVPVHFK